MCRIAGRPSPPRLLRAVIVALLVAAKSPAIANPPDDPKPKTTGSKKADASKTKAKSKAKDADPKADDAKPKTPDEKKVEAKAKQKDAALKVAESYIVLLDKGKYGESWDAMTPEVKKGITRRKWLDAIGKTRGNFGPLQGRKLKKVDLRATEVAEKWDEAWVYTDFQTVDGEAASELLIVVLLNGKDWTVSSYYIGDPANFPKAPSLDDAEPKAAPK